MKGGGVALVAPADASRQTIAKYLRDGGYAVEEHEHLGGLAHVESIVLVDVDASDEARARVDAWLGGETVGRVVVVSSKPSSWKALALARSGDLYVLAAPAFAWEIVDALRATRSVPG